MHTEYRIIEVDDQRFIVTARDPYASLTAGEDMYHVLLETCNLMSAQDFVMRRSLMWSVYLKNEDECSCSDHSDLPTDTVVA